MAITGPSGARGFPGPRGKGDSGGTGAAGNPGVTLTDNLDGSFTIETVNPPQSITFFNGVEGRTPTKGIDYFDGNTGNYISFVYAQVAANATAPIINAGTGSYNGSTEVMPTGNATWTDDPVFTTGQDTYISKGEYVHDITTGGSGVWTLKNGAWSNPVIFTRGEELPQAKIVSYVFRRSASDLSGQAPSGGTYDDPNPDGILWSDGIPAGTAPVYFSKRVFTNDGLSPQELTWSDPVLLVNNGQGTKFQFGPTNTGPWDDVPDPSDEWIIVCAQDLSGIWVCDTANPVKIKGETGAPPQSQLKAYAFKRSLVPITERPTGGSYATPFPVDGVVFGWSENVPSGSGDLYISSRTFTSDGLAPQSAQWSAASLFSGQSAIQLRVEQSAYVWKFDKDGLNPYPNEITFEAFRQNIASTTDWEVYAADDTTVIGTAATKVATDTFTVTASEFGTNQQIRVVATAGVYTDTIYIQRIQDGLQGPAGVATEIREVRFQYSPDNAAWHDAPILGTDRYIREGTFYDGVLQGSYSTGVKFVGDDGLGTYTEFWFSATGTGNPDSNAAEWDRTQAANDFYVIAQTFINAVAQGWGEVAYIRGDDGVDGKFFETQFALSDKDTQPQIDLTSPVAPDFDNTVANPVGWTTNIASLSPTGTQIIWAITSTKLFNGTLDTNWTAAQKWGAYTPVKGNDFTDGLGGVHVSRVFNSGGTAPTLPTGGTWNGVTESGVTDNGWVDDPFSPPTGEYIWVTQQVYTPSINGSGQNVWAVTSPWSVAARYAYIPTFGVDYNDGATGADGESGKGTFTAYVFRNGTSAPLTPTNGSYNGTTETLPTTPNVWTDDPVTPASTAEFTWVSKRVYAKAQGSTTWIVESNWTVPAKFSGSPPFTGYLTNSASVVNAAVDGTGYSLTGTNGIFECYFGTTDVTTSCDFIISGFTSQDATYSYRLVNGLTLRLNKTTGAYDFSGASWTTDQIIFVLTATYPATSTVVTQKLTIAKARTGSTGVSGLSNRLDIAYGTTSAGGVVNYPTSGPASSTGKTYIGTNIVTWTTGGTEPAVSTTAGDYEWSLFKGADGATGPTGPSGSAGVDGDDGTPILWQGTFTSAPGSPQNGWAYYNSTDKVSYVRQDGVWYQMTIDGAAGANGADGADGLSISYRGAFATPPSNPEVNWTYRDTDNDTVYIWNGSAWVLMVADGTNGAAGADGGDGLSVFITYHPNPVTTQPSPPGNTTDGNSGSWTTTPSAASNWMSQKVALTATANVPWGVAIQITGDTGATGSTGATGAATSTRIDFGYADNVSPNPPTLSGHVTGFNSTTQTTSQFLGTNAVTWTTPAAEPGYSNNVLDYEWNQFRTVDTVAFPSNVAGLGAIGNIQSVSLSWTLPTYGGHDYSKIYRHSSNAFGSATYIGSTKQDFFADTSVNSNTTYWYWVANVNIDGTEDTSPATGVSATTGLSFDEATDWITTTQIAPSVENRINLIDASNTGLVDRTTLIESNYVTTSAQSAALASYTTTAALASYSSFTSYTTTGNDNTYATAIHQNAAEGWADVSLRVEADGNVAGIGMTATDAATSIKFNANDVLFTADRFGIVNPTAPDVFPFTVVGGVVYMDSVYVRGTLEAHRIVNIDYNSTKGSASFGDISVLGNLSLPSNSITADMIDQTFINSLVVAEGFVNPGVSASASTGTSVPVGTYAMDGAIVISSKSPTVTVNIQSSWPAGTAPSVRIRVQRRLGAGAWSTIFTQTYTGAVVNGKSEIYVNDTLVVSGAAAGTYSHQLIVDNRTGTWATPWANATVSIFYPTPIPPLWSSGNNWDVIPVIDTSGYLRTGRGLDFSGSDAGTDVDFRVAITSTTTNPALQFINDSGTVISAIDASGYVTANRITLDGGLPMRKLSVTTTTGAPTGGNSGDMVFVY